MADHTNDPDLAVSLYVALGAAGPGAAPGGPSSDVGPGGLSVLVTLDGQGPQRDRRARRRGGRHRRRR